MIVFIAVFVNFFYSVGYLVSNMSYSKDKCNFFPEFTISLSFFDNCTLPSIILTIMIIIHCYGASLD